MMIGSTTFLILLSTLGLLSFFFLTKWKIVLQRSELGSVKLVMSATKDVPVGGNPCEKCSENNRNCVFSIPVNKRGPNSGYVKYLVDTIETLKARLGDPIPAGSKNDPTYKLSIDEGVDGTSPSCGVEGVGGIGGVGALSLGFGSDGSGVNMLQFNADSVPPAADSGSLKSLAIGDWGSAMSGSSNVLQFQTGPVWTHDTFLSATLVGSEGPVPWWDIYYNFVHPKFSFIFNPWFLAHYKDLPLILLHAMYCVSIIYTNGPLDEGEFHFASCKSVIDEAIENPDPLKTSAIFLMAVYSIKSKRVKSAVSYLCLSIRFCQILGIDKGKYNVWKCNLGLIPGFEKESPKEFCRSLWCCLYAHDFYAIFLIGVPGSVTLDIDTSYLQEYRSLSFDDGRNDVKSFLCFCSYYIPLIVIGRKALRLSGNGDNVVLSRNMLLNRLDDWYQSVVGFDPLPESKAPYQSMCSMAFLFPIFHFIRLQLLKTSFLEAITYGKTNNADPIIKQAIDSADAISKSIRMYLIYNPNLLHLTLLMKYCVLFAGAFHCAHILSLQSADGITKKISLLSEHVKFLEIFGLIHPQCLLDAKTLIEWTSSPQGAVEFLRELF